MISACPIWWRWAHCGLRYWPSNLMSARMYEAWALNMARMFMLEEALEAAYGYSAPQEEEGGTETVSIVSEGRPRPQPQARHPHGDRGSSESRPLPPLPEYDANEWAYGIGSLASDSGTDTSGHGSLRETTLVPLYQNIPGKLKGKGKRNLCDNDCEKNESFHIQL